MTPACLPSSRTNAFVNEEQIQTRQRKDIHAVRGPNAKRMSISILKKSRAKKLNKELNIELNRELNKMQSTETNAIRRSEIKAPRRMKA